MDRCSFCGCEIERGTGTTYVQKDGSLLFFCSKKCEKNMLKLRRNPARVRWTRAYRKRAGKLKPEEDVVVSSAAKKPKKGKMPVFEEAKKKEEVKEEKKEETKEAPKEETKEAPKETPKEEKAEAPKEEKEEKK